jgi:hypothetical protein
MTTTASFSLVAGLTLTAALFGVLVGHIVAPSLSVLTAVIAIGCLIRVRKRNRDASGGRGSWHGDRALKLARVGAVKVFGEVDDVASGAAVGFVSEGGGFDGAVEEMPGFEFGCGCGSPGPIARQPL